MNKVMSRNAKIKSGRIVRITVSVFFNLVFAFVVWRFFKSSDFWMFPIAYLGGAVALAVTFGIDKYYQNEAEEDIKIEDVVVRLGLTSFEVKDIRDYSVLANMVSESDRFSKFEKELIIHLLEGRGARGWTY